MVQARWGLTRTFLALAVCLCGCAMSGAGAVADRGERPAMRAADAFGYYLSGWMKLLDARECDRRGKLAEGRAHWEKAVVAFEKGAAADPRSPDIYRALVLGYLRLDDRKKVTETLQRLAAVTPDTPGERSRLAATYADLGFFTTAAAEYEKVLGLTGLSEAQRRATWRSLGDLYRSMGRAAQAVPWYERLVKAAPGDVEAHLGLAHACSEADDHKRAIEVINGLFAIGGPASADDDLPRVLAFLASEYELGGMAAAGADRFATIQQARPDDARVVEMGMLLHERAGAPDKAVAVGRAFLEAHPDAYRLALLLAGMHVRQGQTAPAAALYRRILAARGAAAGIRAVAIRALLGETRRLLEAGNYKAGIAALEPLLEKDAPPLSVAEAVAVRLTLADLYAADGRATAAVELVAPVVAAAPNDVALQAHYADLLARAGRGDEGVALLQGLLKRVGDNKAAAVAVHNGLGRLYELQRRRDLVEKELRAVLELDPKNAVAANHLGYLYAEEGRNLDEAVKLVEVALAAAPKEPAYLDSLGWAYYRLALRDNDLAPLGKALERLRAAAAAINDSVIEDHLGDALFVAGEWEAAVGAWRQAVGHAALERDEAFASKAVAAKIVAAEKRLAAEKKAGGPRKPEARVSRPLAPIATPKQP